MQSTLGSWDDTDQTLIRVVTVGIDVGSSTSQLAISESVAELVGTRFEIVDRRVMHASAVVMTPYRTSDQINGAELERFVLEQFRIAGVRGAEIDGGAVVLTGTALARQN